MLSVPPEWAQAKAETMASAMAAKVFFIFISQRCLKRQALTDHFPLLMFSDLTAGRTKNNSITAASPTVMTKTTGPVRSKKPINTTLNRSAIAPKVLILVDFFILLPRY